MSEHTPGPWGCDQEKVLSVDRYVLARTRPTFNGSYLANARLIAAAPQLLEECKRFREWLETPSKMYDVEALDAAIRKATEGEQ